MQTTINKKQFTSTSEEELWEKMKIENEIEPKYFLIAERIVESEDDGTYHEHYLNDYDGNYYDDYFTLEDGLAGLEYEFSRLEPPKIYKHELGLGNDSFAYSKITLYRLEEDGGHTWIKEKTNVSPELRKQIDKQRQEFNQTLDLLERGYFDD